MGHEAIFKTAFFSVESVVLDHYTVINKNKYSKRPFENFDLKSCLRSLKVIFPLRVEHTLQDGKINKEQK